jgi:hypothetical protein
VCETAIVQRDGAIGQNAENYFQPKAVVLSLGIQGREERDEQSLAIPD